MSDECAGSPFAAAGPASGTATSIGHAPAEGLKFRPSTNAVVAGRAEPRPDGPLAVPPVFSATYHAGGDDGYGRYGNPTWAALEDALGELEGGTAITFASGMAAITSVLESLPVGAVIAAAQQSYSVSVEYLRDRDAAGRFAVHFVDIADTEATCAAIEAGCDAVWFEVLTNPLIDVADVGAIVISAQKVGALTICDDTFLTPARYRPLDHGVDIVVHSVTKALSGHSDVLLGAAVARDPALALRIKQRRSLLGAIPGPMEAWLALRGMRTLSVRMDRAEANAVVLAGRLVDHPVVTKVRYPGLASHPGHDLARRQLPLGCGSILSFEVAGGAVAAETVAGACRLIVHATSVGGVESLIERRRRHAAEPMTTPLELLRLSVGIEDVEDLWADLSHALDVAARLIGG